MSVLGRGRRWLRTRRARALRRRARSLDPDDLADTVETCRELTTGPGGDERLLAVDGLAAVARSGDDHPVRDRAVDGLLDAARDGDDRVEAAAIHSLRYLGLEREAVVGRLDEPIAAALDRWDHPAHDRIAVDAGMLLAREDPRHDLPELRATLRECLVGGPLPVREDAAVACVLVAEHPERFDRPDEVLEHLTIVDAAADGELPPPDSTARRLAGDRTVADAVEAISAARD